jgi:predicted GIY-YIG superfamily endonuclease
MKTWKVYEIINSMGTVEWVGETCRSLESRFYEHKKKPQTNNTCGRFYGRSDVSIHLVAEFNNRPEALVLEKQLKLEYRLELNDFANGKKCRKLTLETAEEIKSIYANTKITQHALGERYGVSRSAIAYIVRGESYNK